MTTEANNPGEGEAAVEGAEGAAAAAVEGTQVETGAVETGQHNADAGSTHIRPEGLPDDLWDDATGVKTGDLWSKFRDLQAKEDGRAAGVPAEAESYDLALPADFKVPEGIEVEIKNDDPLWADFQALGKKHGLTKDGFSEFVGAFAKYQIAAQEADINTFVEQKTALGANADARIKAAGDWLGANLPKTEAEALGGALISAEGVKGLERLISMKSGPTTATKVNPPDPTPTNRADRWYGKTSA